MYNQFDSRQDGNVQGNFRKATVEEVMSWAEDYSPSRRSSPPLEQQEQRCENGWCAEDGSCSCNPCWSGPTCQEYVDRFSPRFLAEEPFFIVDSSTVITSVALPSSQYLDSMEGPQSVSQHAMPASSSFSSSSSTSGGPATVSHLNKGEIRNAKSTKTLFQPFSSSSLSSPPNFAAFAEPPVKSNLLDSNLSNDESKLRSSIMQRPEFPGGGSVPPPRSSPLFRIEAADDDLGLTCQLGQVGPAATCPCATPRYKVIGATTTYPDDRSLASTNHPEETDNNRPLQESSFYNSFPETNLSSFPFKSSSQYLRTGYTPSQHPQALCPNSWTTKCQLLDSIMFTADEETGDVFLQNGYHLQPGRYYFITLQVFALPVNSTGYKPWSEQIVATLYVKPSPQRDTEETSPQYLSESFEGMNVDDVKMDNAPQSSSSLETLETQEVDDDSVEDAGNDDKQHKQEGSHEEEDGEDKEGISLSRSKQVFNYHPLDDLEETGKISNKNNSAPALRDGLVELSEREPTDGEGITGKGIVEKSSYRSTRKQNENHLKLSLAHRMTNAKNKLPYALRADKPHFKYPMNSPVLDSVDTGDSAYEALISSNGYSSKRKKREVPEKPQFQMFISRVDSDGNNSTVLPLGVVTKLKLHIQIVSMLKPRDFTLEIRTLRAKEKNIRFVVLSAYVISIGSDISFDKSKTNLAPLMMSWKNSTVYDAVIWKWKNVKCEKDEQERQRFPSASVHNKTRWNNEIVIEFEIVAINSEEPGNVVNRWISSLSSAPWKLQEKSRVDKSDGHGESAIRHRESSDNLKSTPMPTSTTSQPFGKEFNVSLVSVSAYITLHNGRQSDHHQQQDGDNLETKSVEETRMKVRKESDDNAVGAIHSNVDKFSKGDDASSAEAENYYFDKLINKAQFSTTIMLPVNFSLGVGCNISKTSGSVNGGISDENGDPMKKRFRENRNVAEIDIQLEGPTEIPQGGWVSYVIKVHLNHSSQFQLRLEPVQGNEIQYQDTVSVSDIRVVRIGSHFSSCTNIPKKRGFHVTCRKLNGRKGDYCTVESPIMHYCPTVPKEMPKIHHGADEIKSSGSGEVSSNQVKNDSEEKWNNLVRKDGGKREEMSEEQENMLQFEGVIYGFPGSAPGSQFVLRAHVHVRNIEENMEPGQPRVTSPSTDGLGKNSFTLDKQKTLSGKIVHRKQKIRSKGPVSLDSSNTDFTDGKIPVMREFPAYHYRKRRSIFFERISNMSTKIVPTNNSGSESPQLSPRNNALSSLSDKINQRKVGEMEEKIGASAKKKTSHHVKRTRHSRSVAATDLGNPSSLNLHHFSTWESFVKVSRKAAAVSSNRVKKSKRSSTWSNLL
ncbi:unnamed protein product [Orchesella dallaii]